MFEFFIWFQSSKHRMKNTTRPLILQYILRHRGVGVYWAKVIRTKKVTAVRVTWYYESAGYEIGLFSNLCLYWPYEINLINVFFVFVIVSKHLFVFEHYHQLHFVSHSYILRCSNLHKHCAWCFQRWPLYHVENYEISKSLIIPRVTIMPLSLLKK
jgi:hypothetical protein